MGTLYVDQLANTIRTIDGGNQLTSRELGDSIAGYLRGARVITSDYTQRALADYIRDTNLDKKHGAGTLAELILDRLGLDLDGKPDTTR